MYLVQTFEIGVVIELISSNCNPTATCADSSITGISLISVYYLVNSCKCVMSWQAWDITANPHVSENEININAHTRRELKKNNNTVRSHVLSHACPPNIKMFIYVTDETAWILLPAQRDQIQDVFITMRHQSLCPLSMSSVILIAIIIVRNFIKYIRI